MICSEPTVKAAIRDGIDSLRGRCKHCHVLRIYITRDTAMHKYALKKEPKSCSGDWPRNHYCVTKQKRRYALSIATDIGSISNCVVRILLVLPSIELPPTTYRLSVFPVLPRDYSIRFDSIRFVSIRKTQLCLHQTQRIHVKKYSGNTP